MHTSSLALVTLIVILLLFSLPSWNYSRNWTYGPSIGLGIILILAVILIYAGRL